MASHVAWETLTDDQVQSALIAAGLSAEQTDVIMNMYLSANATSADAAANTADAAAKGANTTATFSLTAALKGLWATIAAHPGVVVLAILTAITAAIVYASGAQERAIQKQREYTEELKQEYSTLQGEVQSLTDELDTAKSRIDELQGKDSLSFVEQEELSRLEKQNELLTKQIELRKLDAAEKAKETNESIAKEFELEYNTTSPKYQSIKTENQVTRTVYAQGEQEEITTGKTITQLELYDELIERAKELDVLRKSMSADEWLASGNQSELDLVNGRLSQMSDGFGTLARKVEDAEGSGAEAFETYYNLFKLGQDAQNGIFWSTAADTAFNKVWDDSKFKAVRDKLQSLADEGGVTVDVLNGDEFKDFLAALGPDLTDTSDKMDDLAAHINSLGVSTDDGTTGLGSLKTALAGLSDETTVLRDAMAKMGEGSAAFDKWIGSDDNLKSLLDKFPNLRDELEAYDVALTAGEDPQKAFITLQRAMNAAMADFNTDAIYEGINDVVSACDTYGTSSNQVLQAVQNLDRLIPGLVDKLYTEENGLLTVASGANFSAAAIYNAAKETIELEKVAGKAKFDGFVAQVDNVSDALMRMGGTAAIAISGLNPYVSLQDAKDQYLKDLDSLLASLNGAYSRIRNDNKKSKKEKEVYVPDVDPLYQYLQTVEDINDDLDRLDLDEKLLDEDDFEGKNKLIEDRIEKLEELKDALHALNDARDVEIEADVKKLNGYGNFQATYDKESGQALINNMDALKGLTGDTAKAAEELISSIENGSKAALSTSKEYMEAEIELRNLLKEQKELREDIIDDRIERLKNQISLSENQQVVLDGGLNQQGSIQKLKEQIGWLEEIQKEAHKTADAIRVEHPGIKDDDPLLQKWIQEYWDAADKIKAKRFEIADATLAPVDEFIEKADEFNWWDNIDTTKVEMLAEQLETVNQLLKDGYLTAEEFKERNDQYAKEIYQTQKDALDTIIDKTKEMIKLEVEKRVEALESEVDDHEKITNSIKERLAALREENNYNKSVAQKTKEIAELQQKINTLALSNDRRDIAERKKLEEELSSLQGDLADTQADHAYDAQVDALDKSHEAFEQSKQDEIKAVQATIDTEGKLYAEAIKRIDSGWDQLYKDLININDLYQSGIDGEDSITSAWNNATEAFQKYKGVLQANQGIEKEYATNIGNSNRVVNTQVNDPSSTSHSLGSKATDRYGMTVDQQEDLNAIVSAMQRNSLRWHTADENGKRDLEKANQDKVAEAQSILAKSSDGKTHKLVLGDDGWWYIDKVGGDKFYHTYHGGTKAVGSNEPWDLKPDEIMAKLQREEAVIPKDHVQPTLKFLEWGSSLASKAKGLFSGGGLVSSALTDAIKGAPLSPAAGAVVNNNAPSFVVNAPVEVKYDSSASPADAKKFGENITAGMLEAFDRMGIGRKIKPFGVAI